MTNPTPPILPFPGDDSGTDDDVATREVDGEETLDPDADADAVDSAEADRLAAEGGDSGDGR
jgi:hypothetical protein